MEQRYTGLKARILLAMLETNVSALALETGIERTALNKVLSGSRVNRAAREKVAVVLGNKVKNLILNQPEANGQTTIDQR